MEHNDNSAERELLKAIEGGAFPSEPVKEKKAAGPTNVLSSVESKVSFFAKRFGTGMASGSYVISLHDVTKVLFIVTAIFAIWFTVVFTKGIIRLENIPKFNVVTPDESKKALKQNEQEIPLAGYTYYADVLLGRNIFKVAEKKKAEGGVVTPKIAEMTRNFKIAGLSWLPETGERFAMVEDTSTGITYFLKEGDNLSIFNVNKILQDSIILKMGNEEIELR